MKKAVLILIHGFLLTGCGGSNQNRSNDNDSVYETTEIVGDSIPANHISNYIDYIGEEELLYSMGQKISNGWTLDEMVQAIVADNVDEKSARQYLRENWDRAKKLFQYYEDNNIAIVMPDNTEVSQPVIVNTTPSNDSHWTGAKSLDELKQKINGTRWYVIDKNTSRVFNLDFRGGNCTISISPVNYEDWSAKTVSCKYQINRGSEGNAAEIVLGKTYDDEVTFSGYVIVFEPGGAKRAVLFQFNNLCGELRQGQYKFNDGI